MNARSLSDRRLVFWPDVDALPPNLLPRQPEPLDAETEALHEALREAIHQRLTPKQREAVQLYFFEGLSQRHIARRLGVSQQVVQRRLFGARRQGRMVGGAINKLREALTPSLP